MKSLNLLINDYTDCLQKGEIQAAYKGILEFIGKLRAYYKNKYPDYDMGSVYQGYMDMSYFSVSTTLLKEKGLKIAIVYLHEKGAFEVWLSARNRETAKSYDSKMNRIILDDLSVFHDDSNQDAIIEYTLSSTPDFENPASLINIIEQGVEKFGAAITSVL